MATVAETIDDRIVVLLSAITGIKSVNTDMVGAQVKNEGADLPMISFSELDYSEEPWDVSNTLKRVDATQELVLFAARGASGTTARSNIMELYGDVKAALEADHTLATSGVVESRVGSCRIGAITPPFNFASAHVSFRYTFHTQVTDPDTP